VRIWDLFFYRGSKILFRFGLAILKSLQENLLGMSLPLLVQHLHTYQLPVDQVVKCALSFRLTSAHLAAAVTATNGEANSNEPSFLYLAITHLRNARLNI